MALAHISQLNHALKEWAIAVDTLAAGKTIMLLRKGGIREVGFQLKHQSVWLYPTYEHQKSHLLKPEYASKVVSVESGWHPKKVTITCCAEITDVLATRDRHQIAALQPYHIWNRGMISDRLNWKPQQPLIVLLLKVFRLTQPQIIPYNDAYGGCKSWIDLVESISTERLIPVMEDSEYSQKAQEIKDIIQS